ncbi:alpha/beta hydrolase [Trichothermofontia sichuanensis B231]|uniref:alpha/beta hydrolase n=1 Tax=Trichothermofontia sichuanensis TaxID=3045816 RepID=UPI002246933D|nr:alpha/beta hydrolase [Trichothermofontia sichuanensis]UZQ54742.1 alpha/beta hydrolase [Trichothermofontia sichuanensis B231]
MAIAWKQLLIGDFSWSRLISSALLIYGALGTWAWFFTDRQIFLPPPATYQDQGQLVWVPLTEDIRLAARYLPHPDAAYTLLYSHGNAEDLGEVEPILNRWYRLGFAVFAYDYPGYGLSQGRATVGNAERAIVAAYDYLTQVAQVPPQQIIVYGRSVGGGPSLYLASQHSVGGVILESTFVSIFRVVTRIPIFPFDKFPNLARLRRVRVPILILHGTQDEVIPLWHGQALFNAAAEPKQALWVEGAGHNDLDWVAGDRYDEALRQFASQLPPVPQPAE